MRIRVRPGVRVLVGAGVLGLLAYLLDAGAVARRLATLDVTWVGMAVAVTVGQTVLSAWRWRFTAGRMSLELPLTHALGEYYRGLFLNQILPGGVLGDANRAWRHGARTREGWGGAARAVLLERVSGQVVMVAFAATSFGVLSIRLGRPGTWLPVTLLGGMSLAAVAVYWVRNSDIRPSSALGALLRDARVALFARDALAVQLITSTLIVGSYVLTYLFAARAVGISTSFMELAPLIPPVLLSMLIPLSVGGWGLREGAAAGLWSAAGLGAADGVAISVAYGLVVLLGTLPGAYLLAFGGPSNSHPRTPMRKIILDPCLESRGTSTGRSNAG